MLLRHTPTEVADRKALTINPAKTCQPIGAMYASLGIHGCLPHSHGSQGCCAYHRSALTRHYKEPVMAATSSFTEGASVFGGQANLLQALNNIFTIYDPEVVAVHSTCLSETIGDDLPQIIAKAIDEGKVPEGKTVIQASTPSYVGSHITGYENMVNGIVKQLSQSSGNKRNQLNLLASWMEPSDMREIKRMMKEMGVANVLLPDTSDVLDAPMTGKTTMYPKGGTTLDEIKSMGDSKSTLALGKFGCESAAKSLDVMHKVPYSLMDIPIGLSGTDRFLMKISEEMGVDVPASLETERGQLLDMVADMNQYIGGKKVALWGDPDTLIPMVEFLKDIGMDPRHIVSGTPGKYFAKRISEIAPDANCKNGERADMFLMHQWIKNEGVDLLIGNTYGKYIARDEDIPFVRHGFPIYDRAGHSYFPSVGYKGALRLLEKILGVIMDRQDRDAPETSFELVM